MHKAIIEERNTHKRPEGFKLHKDDVWGAFCVDKMERVSTGLVVAMSEEPCPIFKDIVPYKSATVVFDPKTHPEHEVEYWLSYVHGGGYSKYGELKDGRIAIRSDYQAW
jgi:hypothetical protein